MRVRQNADHIFIIRSYKNWESWPTCIKHRAEQNFCFKMSYNKPTQQYNKMSVDTN